MNNEKSVTDYFAVILKVTLAVIVIVFLGSESIAFFEFIFPDEQWFMAYTGFGLTSGALLVYLYFFMKDAKSQLQKTVSLIMMAVGIVGEIATAGFGMQVEAWAKMDFAMTESDFTLMVWAVRILMLAHAIALLAYSFGDAIGDAFKKIDKNKNGIPDILEPRLPVPPTLPASAEMPRQYQAVIDELAARIKELENPTNAGTRK